MDLKVIIILPGKHKVGHVQPIPGGVLHEPVAAAAVIDEDHDGDGQPPQGVQ